MEINDKIEVPINIVKTPNSINLSGIEIERGLCFINSYRIAKQNQGVEIVEGMALIVDKQKRASPVAHIWNRLNGIDFDATYESIAEGTQEGIEAATETSYIQYFWVKVYDYLDFKNGDIFEFSPETYQNIEGLKSEIRKKNRGNQS